jgi:hypothetical protein
MLPFASSSRSTLLCLSANRMEPGNALAGGAAAQAASSSGA